MGLIYQRALEIEFKRRSIIAIREVNLPVYYKGEQIGARRVDFLIDGKICVELKAVARLEDVHIAQGLNYLEAYNYEVGLLINFGSRSLEVKRLFNKKFDPLITYNIQKYKQ